MARKCSSCGNNGHNSRTCSGHRCQGNSISISSTSTSCGSLRLFGVQLQVGSSPLKKCLSMECMSPIAYYGAAAATSTLSPSVSSSSSSLASIEESSQRITGGYMSDGLVVRGQDRKKGEIVNKLMFLLHLIHYFQVLFQSFFISTVRLNLFLTLNVVSKLWTSVTCNSLCSGRYVFCRTMFLVSYNYRTISSWLNCKLSKWLMTKFVHCQFVETNEWSVCLGAVSHFRMSLFFCNSWSNNQNNYVRSSMDRGRAPDVPRRPRQAREGRLARHFPTLRHDTDSDPGGQPCPEVLPEAEQPHTEEEEIQPLRCGSNWPELSDQFAFCSLAVCHVVFYRLPTHSAGWKCQEGSNPQDSINIRAAIPQPVAGGRRRKDDKGSCAAASMPEPDDEQRIKMCWEW